MLEESFDMGNIRGGSPEEGEFGVRNGRKAKVFELLKDESTAD
jgi:hypothetical protein